MNDKLKNIDPQQKATIQKMELKKKKYDIVDIQNISIERQKIINKFNKEKKRFKRNKEREVFKQVMASRRDDANASLSFNSDSSMESEHDDIRFLQYKKNLKDLLKNSNDRDAG